LAASACQAHAAMPTGDPAKAENLVNTVCVSCHGADGNGPIPMFPRLAGQSADYLFKQLQDFKSGKRQNDVMSPNAANLSANDMANLAVYFSAKKAVPAGPDDGATTALAKKLFTEGNTVSGVPACASCHGDNGAGADIYPRIASQHADYTLDQLKAFASGKRKNDRRLMQAVAARLTEDEMKALAPYLASMP